MHLIVLLISMLFFTPSWAEEKGGAQFDTEAFLQYLYKDVKLIDSFGFIHFHVKGDDKNKLGLSDEDLTNYLKLRFKNNFANVRYKEAGFDIPEELKKKTGILWCGVWTVGDDYPVAYHVECRMGSYENPRVFEDAVLGYGSKDNVPDTVKQSVDRMVSEFAINFFKHRGEM